MCQLQSSGGCSRNQIRDLVFLKSDLVKAKTKQIQQPALWPGESSCTAAIIAELVLTEMQGSLEAFLKQSEVQSATQPENTSGFSLAQSTTMDGWLFVWISRWTAICLSMEAVVGGIQVATYYRSPLLHISEMFANFEMFQMIVNNILFSPCSIFTPKRRRKTKQQPGIFKVSQEKVTLYCALLCNRG